MLNQDVPAFQNALLHWYGENGRSFPWRNRQDPFAVLLSEKLLQQTAARPIVVHIFNTLLKNYPTPEALAHADVKALEALIQPLGFLYRARELPEFARVLIERHKGCVPATLKELLALPGVGDYAARAVLSFAFRQDVPIFARRASRYARPVQYNLTASMVIRFILAPRQSDREEDQQYPATSYQQSLFLTSLQNPHNLDYELFPLTLAKQNDRHNQYRLSQEQ